jgi:hypothetical protein
MSKPTPFECPHCKAKYDVVRMEAPGVEADTQVSCISCGGPLPGREGPFLLKYFLVSRRLRTRAAAGVAVARASQQSYLRALHHCYALRSAPSPSTNYGPISRVGTFWLGQPTAAAMSALSR